MNQSIIFKAELLKFDVNLALHYIQVPEELISEFATKFPFRVFCTIKTHTFPAAIVKHGIDGLVIQMGKQTIKASGCRLGEELVVTLVQDDTEHGYAMPEEFIVLLDQDTEGREAWEELRPGAQRSLLYYLVGAKSQETRIKRSLIILKRAREIKAERVKKANQKNKKAIQ